MHKTQCFQPVVCVLQLALEALEENYKLELANKSSLCLNRTDFR